MTLGPKACKLTQPLLCEYVCYEGTSGLAPTDGEETKRKKSGQLQLLALSLDYIVFRTYRTEASLRINKR